MREAQSLRKLFEYIGDRVGINIEVIITDGSQPIGNGIGPVLEVADVMMVLQNDPRAPLDLREKSLQLAGRMIEFAPDVRGGDGYAIARDILDSGRALQTMNAIIDAQGRQPSMAALGSLYFDVTSPRAGVVSGIDNFHLARVARYAGAPMQKGAGVALFKKIGDAVDAGEALYRVYAEFAAERQFAANLCSGPKGHCGYEISDALDATRAFVVA